jgi:lipopolysaccharide/colanic/teichoic acid biosynthesis glycosyltransferase
MKTLFDRLVAAAGLIVFAPVLAACAVAVVLQDGGPVFFRQWRVGRYGKPFQILKFRSMRAGRAGTQITAAGDPRVTRAGRVLRRYKLDELPQLWNVLRGDMSFVGPRPEVPMYVDLESDAWKAVLQVRPGITDLATVLHRNEEELLSQAGDPESYYRNVVLPAKLQLNIDYLRSRSFWTDLELLFVTVRYSFLPGTLDESGLRRRFLTERTA